MLRRLLAPSFSLESLPDASVDPSLAGLVDHVLFRKKAAERANEKSHARMRPRMALFRWLISPAGIGRQRRPNWLFNEIIPSIKLQKKNVFLGACQSYRRTLPSASIRIGLHPNDGDGRQFRFFSSRPLAYFLRHRSLRE
jgi:hypothetical protein